MLFKFFRLYQFSKRNHDVFLVRNLNTDRRLSGNRCLDTNIRRCQIQLDVVGQIDNFADLYSHLRLQFIARHGGTAADIGNRDIHAKIL